MLEFRPLLVRVLKKAFLLDFEDQLRAQAKVAHDVAKREFQLNAKRSREVEGAIRFRLQEEAYEEVVQRHGGQILSGGVLLDTDLKIFQPFARFHDGDAGVVLGFATMPEPKKMPHKNRSRLAGVRLNVGLKPDLFEDGRSVRLTDLFVLFLAARDKSRAGMVCEVALGVIDSAHSAFLFYQSLDEFISTYERPPSPEPGGGPDRPALVTLRAKQARFVPPESKPTTKVEDDAG